MDKALAKRLAVIMCNLGVHRLSTEYAVRRGSGMSWVEGRMKDPSRIASRDMTNRELSLINGGFRLCKKTTK
jgi:hypothetical protein